MKQLSDGAGLALLAVTAAMTAGGASTLCRRVMDAAGAGLGDAPASDLARLDPDRDGTRVRFAALGALNSACAACGLCKRGRTQAGG